MNSIKPSATAKSATAAEEPPRVQVKVGQALILEHPSKPIYVPSAWIAYCGANYSSRNVRIYNKANWYTPSDYAQVGSRQSAAGIIIDKYGMIHLPPVEEDKYWILRIEIWDEPERGSRRIVWNFRESVKLIPKGSRISALEPPRFL